ncbi:MAG: hypothetical protein GWO20_16650 [Candidatus Korarchaeota archaeon]|nr:hypothetical protein [Candidatus Korarchaeota archaeon]NIU85034.1 hypothetical protein [Candidatus Thorarchaeota archaeon]NIW15059.1 hypothetical protein [Candidatus Thorarchaeota archaeon]NIW53069.1 hypothetical protein [Candidatus Korarchaeota archaeon]
MEIYGLATKERSSLFIHKTTLYLCYLGISFGLLGIVIELRLHYLKVLLDITSTALSLLSALFLLLLANVLLKTGYQSVWMKLATALSIINGAVIVTGFAIEAMIIFGFFSWGVPFIISHVFLPAMFSITLGQGMRKAMDLDNFGLGFMLIGALILILRGGAGLTLVGVLCILSGRKIQSSIKVKHDYETANSGRKK